MAELDDYCQCCFVPLGDNLNYRCDECLNSGACSQCGKCINHCEHVEKGEGG